MSNSVRKMMYANGDFKEGREADKIIAYLRDPESGVDLNKTLQNKLDLYVQIYNLKLEFNDNKHILGILKKTKPELTDRKARTAISETEYIFGKVNRVDMAFEKAFLIEASRKNLKLAFASEDTTKISKALEAHKKIIGEEIDESELPDFSKLQPHTYFGGIF